eukprot:m.50870 g.50870  ORF g.50870 m.50870 type:complete len:903 (+) comp7538_c0_seq1:90-2798(+)
MDPSSNPPSSPTEYPSSPPGSEGQDQYEDETEGLRQDEALPFSEPMHDDLEEEEGEELFGENMERDYREIKHLDTYDPQMLDEEDYEDLSLDARRVAEREMAKRDAIDAMRVRGKTRVPVGLGFGRDDDEADEDEEPELGRVTARHRRLAERVAGQEAGELEEDEDETVIESLSDRKGKTLREWVTFDPVKREIYNRFKNFLRTATDEDGQSIYGKKIQDMCQANGESLIVSYINLCQVLPEVALFLADAPTEILAIFDAAAKDVVLEHYPHYENIKSDIHVRIGALPVTDAIRDIRQTHLNVLVRITGVVTRRTGVFPQLKTVKYNCDKCGMVIGPIVQDSIHEARVQNCPNCQSRGPFSVNMEETVYRNYQRITVQESPGSVPAGRLPRQKEVVLLWDHVDFVKPGDEIDVTGIYRNNFDKALNSRHGFPIFATVIEANYIEKKADKYSTDDLTDEDKRTILRFAEDPAIGDKIIQSIAPSIYGHDDVKTAIALSMFGSNSKERDGHRVRGDINILLLGDPGTAKSQFLKYVEKTAHRAVFTTGQGASAVGLTASVSRDPVTREWTLQGGALVLADQGVCLIDEFDKMNDQDRTSIHEAMEQQSISVSKAGIVTTLQARCAVIAAANPIKGKYQPGKTFSQNVDLTEPILSRFDILCVVKDVVDAVKDEKLASFVVKSHINSHPSNYEYGEQLENTLVNAKPPLSQDELRKYLQYSRRYINPDAAHMDQHKISSLYADVRREAQQTGSLPITVRHVEGIIRIAEANARMHLRSHVRSDDIDMAIRVALKSFIDSQKFSVMKGMRRTFQKYLRYKTDDNKLLMSMLVRLYQQERDYLEAKGNTGLVSVDKEEFENTAKQYEINDLSAFFKWSRFSKKFCIGRHSSDSRSIIASVDDKDQLV